jgi:hypothetical protein
MSKLEEFIRKAREIHGDLYDYSDYVYINTETPSTIYCYKCEDTFEKAPYYHINLKKGCTRCSRRNMGKNKTKTHEQFVKEAREIYRDQYEYLSEYKGGKFDIVIRCIPCDFKFNQTAQSHISGHGCSECGKRKISEAKKKTLDQFLKQAIEIHGDLYDYSEFDYQGAQISSKIGCKRCKQPFMQTPDSHINKKSGCPVCAMKNVGNMKLKSHEMFLHEARAIHANKYEFLTEYLGWENEIQVQCQECKYEWSPKAGSILKGTGCPKCNGGIKKTKEEFIEEARARRLDFDDYDFSKVDYKNSGTHVILIHKICGKEIKQTPDNFLQGYGCNACPGNGTSKECTAWLDSIQKDYPPLKREFKIPGSNYRADAYCEEWNLVLEYHGAYWHICPDCRALGKYEKLSKEEADRRFNGTKEKKKFIVDIFQAEYYAFWSCGHNPNLD